MVTPDLTRTIDDLTARLVPELLALRRHLHANPELAFCEHRTAAHLGEWLQDRGISVQDGIGGTGLIADVGDGRPRLLLRADMDALPIAEATGLPFSSRQPGVMHACGHDLHMAIVAGAGVVLRRLAPAPPGAIRLMFQPAEETLAGARAMIDAGVLEGVDLALGLHNRPDLPTGRIGLLAGPTTASADRFTVTLTGPGSHASRQHTGRNPVLAAATLAGRLSTIVGTCVTPGQAAILAVTAIQGGTSHNVIPGECGLLGTIRTRHAEARQVIEEALRRCCAATEAETGLTVALLFEQLVPAQVNDARLLPIMERAIHAQLGDVEIDTGPSMGSEDFAFISERVPAFRIHLGAARAGYRDAVHTATYTPNEDCIAIGVRAMVRAALELLRDASKRGTVVTGETP